MKMLHNFTPLPPELSIGTGGNHDRFTFVVEPWGYTFPHDDPAINGDRGIARKAAHRTAAEIAAFAQNEAWVVLVTPTRRIMVPSLILIFSYGRCHSHFHGGKWRPGRG